MLPDDIAPDVRRFLANAVPSVPFLEALLLLHSEPEGRWSVQRLASRLYLPQRRVQALLDELSAAALVRADESGTRWQFTDDADCRALVDQVAEVYARNLVGVASFIHAKADDSAERFAAAFKLTKR